jgi:cytochrome c oxidase assembly protein subunit 15
MDVSRSPRGDRVRKATVATGILLITEGALGALLVLGHYVENNASTARVIVQCVHFSNTMLLLAAMTLTWWWLRPREVTPLCPTGRIAAILALLATLLTGATGSVAALADTLFPSPSLHAALAQDFSANAPLLIRMRWIHPAAALLRLRRVSVAAAATQALSRVWLAAAFAQIALGIADVLLLAPLTCRCCICSSQISTGSRSSLPAPACSCRQAQQTSRLLDFYLMMAL